MPNRLAAGIASLWALLSALLREGASSLFARPWWRRVGEDNQGQEGGRPQGPSGGDPPLLDGGLRFPGNQKYARPEIRPMGEGDTLIDAAVAYIQFKKWDKSLIDRALD